MKMYPKLKMYSKLALWLSWCALTSASASASSMITTGDCSPIVTEVRGNVSVSCSVVANKIPVYKFTGALSTSNANSFTKFVDAHENDIIELLVWFEEPLTYPRQEGLNYAMEMYYADNSNNTGPLKSFSFLDWDGTFGIDYAVSPDHVNWTNGPYIIAGYFYIEKYQGMHQGIVSVGLIGLSKGELLIHGRINQQ